MIKLTILYGHPANAKEFEDYYAQTHHPLAAKIRGVQRLELTKFLTGSEGGPPAFYRMAELYFSSEAQMLDTLSSPEAQAAVADLQNFATGGVTVMIGSVES
jgi:uncharacterized protein (TIGR02118 family)